MKQFTCVTRWSSRPPYAGEVSGVVASRDVSVFQSRWGISVEYCLLVGTASDRTERVAVSAAMYQKARKGWRIRQHKNVVTATSPDHRQSATSVLP